jgi:hypothetical protein
MQLCRWAMFFPPDIAHLGYRRTRRDSAGRRAEKIASG